MSQLADLTALDARERMLRGEFSAEELTTACLQRIAGREQDVRAWTYVDNELALTQARAADELRRSGRPPGALHGVPVGVKDIIDTADMPTGNGTPADAGRRPGHDATVVARLRAAGAVILGKTVTTECAHLAPGKTRNPHNLEHTPGGSSSGSAAAVAAGMVPLAVGTQTGGSVIRPAAFCGVFGIKPTFGLIPRTGVLSQSTHLDTIGTFGRTLEDAALLADVLAGYDAGDADSLNVAPPQLLDTALTDPPVTPALAFVRTAAWKDINEDCAQGFAGLVEALGEHCDEVELSPMYAEAAAAQQTLAQVGMARSLRHYYERGRERLAAETRNAIEQGRNISAVDYLAARDRQQVLHAGLEDIFQRYDAFVTPATTGEAPRGFDTTGNPAFCVLWTLTGVPAVTLPLLHGANGLPIGVQLVGRRGYDGCLLRTAHWLMKTLDLPFPRNHRTET
jgi:Asp-tRNA(Asn)/Glu-tRNA(Gln) amidotransferase A subunit family amidase